MKNFYIAVDVQKDDGTRRAYVFKVSEIENVAAVLSGCPGYRYINANIAPTKKAAYELAQLWNHCHERDGNYNFSA